jgi:antirestriction protein ArdC
MARKTPAQIREQVTSMMITALEQGTVPWHKPWTTRAGTTNRPASLSSRKPYRGTNVWILGLTALTEGYTSPWWGTYGQIAELSGMVRQPHPDYPKRMIWVSPDGAPRGIREGEKSTEIVFSKSFRVDDKDTAPTTGNPHPKKTIHMLRFHRVFNACQADGLPEKYYGTTPTPEGAEISELSEPQAVLDAYIADGPSLRHVHQDRAYYTWAADEITLPERDQFGTAEEYYSTAFHEAGHSTGHKSRLDRDAIDHFGGQKYSAEELVAEMTAAMLCALTGVEGVFDNSASYIASWLRKLKGDSDLVIHAASQAQAAVDLILADEAGEEEDDDTESEAQAA